MAKKPEPGPDPEDGDGEILAEYDVQLEERADGTFRVTCPVCTAGIVRWSERGAQKAIVDHLDYEHAITGREDS